MRHYGTSPKASQTPCACSFSRPKSSPRRLRGGIKNVQRRIQRAIIRFIPCDQATMLQRIGTNHHICNRTFADFNPYENDMVTPSHRDRKRNCPRMAHDIVKPNAIGLANILNCPHPIGILHHHRHNSLLLSPFAFPVDNPPPDIIAKIQIFLLLQTIGKSGESQKMSSFFFVPTMAPVRASILYSYSWKPELNSTS